MNPRSRDVLAEPEPKILERADHPISRKQIDSNALKVLYRLHNAGYKGYLVGGSVRDMMLGRQPKDFDISTDALPGELRKIFRNARIIGRRFRLAHVIFRDQIVEVSTFRCAPDPEEQEREAGELLITSDNAFGTPREDAFRRDFTINGLFYNIADFTVIDYLGGTEDLERRLIRVIGDPDVRFAEDPVRMLRACEFAGRLGFAIEPRTQEGIYNQRAELLKAAPPRLIEELIQLLRSGHLGASMQWMLELGVVEVLLPEALAALEAKRRGAGDLTGILSTLDRLAAEGRELSEGVLLAALLLPKLLLERFEAEMASGRFLTLERFRAKVEAAIDQFCERFSLSNARRTQLESALEGFHRLCGPWASPAQRRSFAAKRHFRDALVLFEILVRTTGEGAEELESWRRLPVHAAAPRQTEARSAQAEPAEAGPAEARPAARRRRRPRRRRS